MQPDTITWTRDGVTYTAVVLEEKRTPKPGQRFWHGWIPVDTFPGGPPRKPERPGRKYPVVDEKGRPIEVGSIVTLPGNRVGRVTAIRPSDEPGWEHVDAVTLQGDTVTDIPVKAAGLMIRPDGAPDSNPRPEPGDTPYPTAAKTLVDDVASGVASYGEIGLGATATVDRVEFASGGLGIRKTLPSEDMADREELGALVGYAVGARVPAAHRPSGGDGRQVWLQYGSAPMGIEVDGARRQDRDLAAFTPDGRRIGLLDVLIGNDDRNVSNWLVDGEKVTGIDHANASFEPPVPGGLPQVRKLTLFVEHYLDKRGEWKANDLTAADVTAIRERLAEVRPRFEELGRLDWWENVNARLDKLAENAQKGTS